jgi:hypothetical protein
MTGFITGRTRGGRRIRGRFTVADGRVTVTAIAFPGSKSTHADDEASARALAPIMLREIAEDAEGR